MFAAGSYHSLSFIPETTFGTTPAGTFTALRHTSCSLGITKDGFQSNELRSDRQISDFRHGVVRVQGDVGIELSYGEFDTMLEGALFNNWNSHVLKCGVLAKSFTFRRRFADILLDGLFTGVMVNNFSLSIPANAMVTGSFGFVGKEGQYVGTPHSVGITVTTAPTTSGNATVTVNGVGTTVALLDTDTVNAAATKIAAALDLVSGYAASATDEVVTLTAPALNGAFVVEYGAGTTGSAATVGTATITAPTASQINSPFDSFTGALKEGGSTIAVITSIDMSLENSLEPVFVVGANTTPRIVPGRSNLTGTVSAYFENKTMLDKFLQETESSIELTLGGSTKKYDFHIPRLKYTGGSVDVSGEGPITMNMPWQALYDSGQGTNLKITRTPA